MGKGDPLHELRASRHSVLNWAAALQADQPITGAAPATMLPAIDQQLIDQVVLEHVRGWPEWVEEMQHARGQAYAVLTLVRRFVVEVGSRLLKHHDASGLAGALIPHDVRKTIKPTLPGTRSLRYNRSHVRRRVGGGAG